MAVTPRSFEPELPGICEEQALRAAETGANSNIGSGETRMLRGRRYAGVTSACCPGLRARVARILIFVWSSEFVAVQFSKGIYT